ncbi:MAG: BrnT family toxin [Candidatus Shapirobacteria bacterium]
MLYNIRELIWDDWNVEHIKKHNVCVIEVEEACFKLIKSFKSYQNRLIILGETKNNRLLTLVLIKKSEENYYVVTARDMSRKERRLINER